MTLPALYRLEASKRLSCPIVGVAMDSWDVDELRVHAREWIKAVEPDADAASIERLMARLSYVAGDFTDSALYARITAAIGSQANPLFYLEIPPSLFGPVAQQLANAGLMKGARVIFEKPFGHDLASAQALNRDLHKLMDESQIYRIDHFLGKEPVMDIHYLRFANEILAPVWNADHIACVQITLAETFGVESRGSFYDAVGALRDVVQNHLLQVLALIAMEPPDAPGADVLRDNKAAVLRAIPQADPQHYVRGQYEGYAHIPGVKPGSQTETYAALRLEIDDARWAGVPFFIRAGKQLAASCTEARIIFNRAPLPRFMPEPEHPEPNQLVLRIDPSPGLRIELQSLGADEVSTKTVHLDMSFAREIGVAPEPYERLLDDAMQGDAHLFTREDSIEETWRILQPLLDNPSPIFPYAKQSWGPAEADRLVQGHCGWQQPWTDR
ncbi:MAG: glucose-6-phosphate dehydrogenase [Actinomycetota bacterium]